MYIQTHHNAHCNVAYYEPVFCCSKLLLMQLFKIIDWKVLKTKAYIATFLAAQIVVLSKETPSMS